MKTTIMKQVSKFSILALLTVLIITLCSPLQSRGALLLAMYQKMRLVRERNGVDPISEADSIGAEQGNVSAMIKYGAWCVRNNRVLEGKTYLEKASVERNDTAKCYLAELYIFKESEGLYNPDLAIEIINGIHIQEKNFLKAIMYYEGYGCERNYHKAYELFSSISEESFYSHLALYYLSKCYRYGRGIDINLNKSSELIRKACVKPLNARNLEESKPSQFVGIIYPKSDKVEAEMEAYKKLVGAEVENANPTFELR